MINIAATYVLVHKTTGRIYLFTYNLTHTIMRTSLLAISICALLASCTKTADDTPVRSLGGFRQPSCEDRSDDGVPEDYNEAEARYFLESRYPNPTGNYGNYLVDSPLLNKSSFKKGDTASLYLNFYAHTFLYCETYIVDSPRVFRSMLSNWHEIGPTQYAAFSPEILRQLAPGCHRLYYIFSSKDKPVNTYGGIMNKGHLDFTTK